MNIKKIIMITFLTFFVLIIFCGAWFFKNIMGKTVTQKDLIKDLPKQYIIPNKPEKFLTTEDLGQTYPGHCGVYTAKAVLDYFQKESKDDPRDYHVSWIAKTFKSVLPQSMRGLLNYYGLRAEVKTAKNLSDENKLKALKQEIIKDSPVLLLTGSGSRSDGTYKPEWRKYPGHWISIWGYNDEAGVFYIYNNSIQNKLVQKDLPNGNITRTYQDLLTDWYGPFYMFPARYTYVSIIK